MKMPYSVGLALIAGVLIGAATIQMLHAQSKPPVYMIAINEVSNEEGYTKEYAPAAMKSIKEQGGVYVAAGPGTQITGSLPKGRTVILRWESLEALQKWRNSPEYQAALKVGEKYAKYNIVAVNGVAQ